MRRRDLGQQFLRHRVILRADPHRDVRDVPQFRETVGRELRNFGERFTRQQRRRELARDRQRQLRRLRLQACARSRQNFCTSPVSVSDTRSSATALRRSASVRACASAAESPFR